MSIRLLTIGFTETTAEQFFTILRNGCVKKIVDVRLNNTSQLAGFSKRDDLRRRKGVNAEKVSTPKRCQEPFPLIFRKNPLISPPWDALFAMLSAGLSTNAEKVSGTISIDFSQKPVNIAAMGRALRNAVGGIIYHAFNRANGRLRIFDDEADYQAFEKIMSQAAERTGMQLLGWCIMPNHWHLLLKPGRDGELSNFMRWLTLTHTQRWHANRHNPGSGHVYQGRFKSFPIQEDTHFLTVARYIERNPLRAKLVSRAERWRWSSLFAWEHETAMQKLMAPWPMRRPAGWIERVNEPMTRAETEAMRTSLKRGRPFGEPRWQMQMAEKLGLQITLRPRGRPKNGDESEK